MHSGDTTSTAPAVSNAAVVGIGTAAMVQGFGPGFILLPFRVSGHVGWILPRRVKLLHSQHVVGPRHPVCESVGCEMIVPKETGPKYLYMVERRVSKFGIAAICCYDLRYSPHNSTWVPLG